MFKLIALPFRSLVKLIRLAGVRNSLLFGSGVVVGVLIAPATGAQTRALIAHRIASARVGRDSTLPPDADLSL